MYVTILLQFANAGVVLATAFTEIGIVKFVIDVHPEKLPAPKLVTESPITNFSIPEQL